MGNPPASAIYRVWCMDFEEGGRKAGAGREVVGGMVWMWKTYLGSRPKIATRFHEEVIVGAHCTLSFLQMSKLFEIGTHLRLNVQLNFWNLKEGFHCEMVEFRCR